MPAIDVLGTGLGWAVLLLPVTFLIVLGISSLIDRPLSEFAIGRLIRLMTALGLLASLGVLVVMLANDRRYLPLVYGNWVEVPHYHFSVKFIFDRLSVPLVILTFVLCGSIGAFATRYMHHERGYNRFFVQLGAFILGMVVTCLAGTVETLFLGWEFVGLSSALLVAFFHDRPAPVRNGLRVWIVYRVSDAALLLAAVVMHHMIGGGDFDSLLGTDPAHPWPEGGTSATPMQALVVGSLLLVAAAGKSALVPFSGWLPRAMEGPTPSSAVFYGALSVHLGAFLLLRMSPLLLASPTLAGIIVALGLVTSVYAYITGSVQTDIKSALSFASLVQVGLIVAEIGLGSWIPFLWYFALVHLIGHACMRTLQFVRAPTLLQDYRHLEDAIGARLQRPRVLWVRLFPKRAQGWLYRFAIERGYLDTILTRFIAMPFLGVFRWFDDLERRWSHFMQGQRSEQPRPGARPSGECPPVATEVR